MPDPHSNFAYSTVLTAPSPAASGTSLVVQAADGTKFPSSGSFNATVWPVSAQPTAANAEIVRVTAISTDTFTITRAQESTSARTIVVGDQIAATVTAKTLTDVELANSYLTSTDQTVTANTQIIYDDYLELAASFVYELASGAVTVLGDFATPALAPHENPSIFLTVADETVPSFSEVVFSDYYELSAPFVVELAGDAVLQLGTGSAVAVLGPGYEIGYAQITATVNITDTAEATATPIISSGPLVFDGAPVIAEFFSEAVICDTAVATDQIFITLFEGKTEVGRLAQIRSGQTATTNIVPVCSRYRFTPTAGIHSYNLCSFASSTTGTPGIVAGTGAGITPVPAYLRFTKV